MILLECLLSAWKNIRTQGLRSLLSTIGIIIGVASVIAVISIVQGLSRSLAENFDRLGANSIVIEAKNEPEELTKGRVNYLSFRDYEQIKRHTEGVTVIAASFDPYGAFGIEAKSGRYSGFLTVKAVTPTYQDVQQLSVELGRVIRESDNQSRRKICVIGNAVKEKLKLHDPIGEFLEIQGEWYKIVGVMEARGTIFGVNQDSYVLLPFSVGEALLHNQESESLTITLNIVNQSQQEIVQGRLRRLLRKQHKLANSQADDFIIQSAQQLAVAFSSIMNTTSLVLSGIVGISLLVGGVGIMNMMLISVTERTREIGLLKALGAKRRHILFQFLFEAMTLSSVGGCMGLMIGYGLGMGFSHFVPDFPAAYVPGWAIVLALGFSTTVGLLFGIIPAVKAAGLEPIDALRYE